MSVRRVIVATLGGVLAAVVGLALDARNNTAEADDSICFGNSGNLCRTTQVKTCIEWGPSSLTFSLTGGGISIVCKQEITETWYYYYETSSGSGNTKPGLT